MWPYIGLIIGCSFFAGVFVKEREWGWAIADGVCVVLNCISLALM